MPQPEAHTLLQSEADQAQQTNNYLDVVLGMQLLYHGANPEQQEQTPPQQQPSHPSQAPPHVAPAIPLPEAASAHDPHEEAIVISSDEEDHVMLNHYRSLKAGGQSLENAIALDDDDDDNASQANANRANAQSSGPSLAQDQPTVKEAPTPDTLAQYPRLASPPAQPAHELAKTTTTAENYVIDHSVSAPVHHRLSSASEHPPVSVPGTTTMAPVEVPPISPATTPATTTTAATATPITTSTTANTTTTTSTVTTTTTTIISSSTAATADTTRARSPATPSERSPPARETLHQNPSGPGTSQAEGPRDSTAPVHVQQKMTNDSQHASVYNATPLATHNSPVPLNAPSFMPHTSTPLDVAPSPATTALPALHVGHASVSSDDTDEIMLDATDQTSETFQDSKVDVSDEASSHKDALTSPSTTSQPLPPKKHGTGPSPHHQHIPVLSKVEEENNDDMEVEEDWSYLATMKEPKVSLIQVYNKKKKETKKTQLET